MQGGDDGDGVSPRVEAEGAFADLLSVLADSLNFTVSWRSPADGQWGVLAGNGTHEWMKGLSGDLQFGRADLCTAGQYMSLERQAHTDMVALLTDYSTLVVPRKEHHGKKRLVCL